MNAYEMPIQKLSGLAGADFSAKRFFGAVRQTDGTFAVAGAGVAITGVIQDAVGAGQTCGVMSKGVSFCVFGGTVTAGAEVEINADGKFIALNTGIAVGICEVGGAADEIGSVSLY